MIPHVSLIECIDHYGIPISMVFMQVYDDIKGPIVVPHGESFFTIKSYIGT